MKKLLLLSFLLLPYSFLFAQAPTWTSLLSGVSGNVYATAFYNGTLIAGGSFTAAGSVSTNHIAMWDGSSWTALGLGTSGSVRALCVYHNQLYVAGTFTTAGGISSPKIARWNGNSWDSVGHGITGSNVYSMEVYHDKLYVGGKFTMAGSVPANNIAIWDDNSWSAAGAGIEASWGGPTVYAIKTFEDTLYVGGLFDMAGGVSTTFSIAKWDGANWSGVGYGFDYEVLCLESSNGILYAGGDFSVSGIQTTNYIAQLNNGVWMGVNNGADYIVYSMAHYGSDLYIAGDFWNIGNVLCYGTARYDGTNFFALGSGVDNTAFSICADEAIVYVGGLFANAGSVPAARIAKWSQAGVGISEHSMQNDLAVYPNPSHGIFNMDLSSEKECTIEVYNAVGELINSFTSSATAAQVDLTNENAGICLIKVISDGQCIAQRKVVLQ